jgi:hypothetical protein
LIKKIPERRKTNDVGIEKRPLKNVQFCPSSGKAKILTAGVPDRLRKGLKLEVH